MQVRACTRIRNVLDGRASGLYLSARAWAVRGTGGYKANGSDTKADRKHRQRALDAFHTAEFFVDNTADRFVDCEPNPDWASTRFFHVSSK